MKDKKIIFMGTPDFASHILERLIEEGYNIALVVTQPDKKFGRKQELRPSEVKQVALANGIEVFQPTKIREDFAPIVELQPDLIITAAYGQIVPDEVLNAPKYECINVHGSLLPKYRGGAPIHYAVMDGETKTGVTIMEMVAKMDAGDIIVQAEMPITLEDTVGTTYDTMKQLGAETLLETLPKIFSGDYTKTPQNEDEVTYAWNITREQEKVSFDRPVKQVFDHIRGLNPFPVAYMQCNEKRYKLYASTMIEEESNEKPGTIIAISKEGIQIACQDGIINITEIQASGKKRMLVRDYVNGKVELAIGDICE